MIILSLLKLLTKNFISRNIVILIVNCVNAICLISCTNCNEQYVDSAIDFKKRFKIYKSDTNTNKDRCGAACHFTNKCQDPLDPHAFLKIQPIEQVCIKKESKLNDTL